MHNDKIMKENNILRNELMKSFEKRKQEMVYYVPKKGDQQRETVERSGVKSGVTRKRGQLKVRIEYEAKF